MKNPAFILATFALLSGCFLTESKQNVKFERIETFVKEEEVNTEDLNLNGSVRSIIKYEITANDSFLDVGLTLEENPKYRQISADPFVKRIWASSFNNCYSVLFNKNGKAIKEISWYKTDGQSDTRNTSIYKYDSTQNLVEKIDSISYGTNNELYKKQSFMYHKGALIQLKSLHTRDKKQEKISTISYKGTDARVKTIEKDAETGEILRTSSSILNINGEINKDAETETREFDALGNLVKVSIKPAIGLEPTVTILFNYDNDNNLIQRVTFDKNNELLSQESNFYDSKGNLILKLDEWSGGLTRDCFNDLGQLLKEQRIYYADSLGNDTKIEYRYDDLNNLIRKKVTYKEDGELKSTEKKYKLRFDKNGNWVEKRCFDGDKLTFIERRDILYY